MNFNKRLFLWILLLCATLIICVVYFYYKSIKNNIDDNELIYDFGIISTVAHREKSIINYYKIDGELVKSQKLKMAWLGNSFGSFGETENFVYTKVDNKKGTIFELNKKNGAYKVYDLAYNSLTVSAEDEYVYFANSNTKCATIYKFNTLTNELNEIELEKNIIGTVYPYKDNVYVSSIDRDEKSYIHIIDKHTFKLKEKIENTMSGGDYHIYGTNDKVYFASNINTSGTEGSNILIEYDTISSSFYTYELDDKYLYDIFEYDGSLIITHIHRPTSQGKNITIFDLTTREKKIVTLKNNLLDSAIKDNVFISCDSYYAYIYSIPEFTLLNQIEIKPKEDFITTLFTN